MKASVTRSALDAALTAIKPALSSRPTHPIIAGVVLDVTDELTVSATDYDLTITRQIDLESGDPGKVIVSGHRLRDLVAKFTGSTVTLALEDDGLRVTCGRASYRLGTMPVAEYPENPPIPERTGEIPAGSIERALHSTSYADASDQAQLQGALLDVVDGAMWCVTTDSYRFAAHPVPYRGDEVRVRVTKASLQAARLLGGDLTVHVDENRIGFVGLGGSVVARLLEYDGVAWQRVVEAIPDDELPFETSTDEVLAALDRSVMATVQKGSVWLRVAGDLLTVTADTAEDAGGVEEIPLTKATDDCEFAVSPTKLRDALAALDSDRVRIHARENPVKPFLIRGLEDDGTATPPIHVLMPIRRK